MSARLWIRRRYFKRVPTTVICRSCKHWFTYTKTSKPAPVLLGLQAGTASNADENLRTVFAER